MGGLLIRLNRLTEAMPHYRTALEIEEKLSQAEPGAGEKALDNINLGFETTTGSGRQNLLRPKVAVAAEAPGKCRVVLQQLLFGRQSRC